MTWFHFTSVERFRAQCDLRCDIAQRVQHDAEHSVDGIYEHLSTALQHVATQERWFISEFGEPPPKQLTLALRFEMLLWRRLQAAMDRTGEPNKTPPDLAKDFCALLRIIIDVLHAEKEMTQSCLIRHYIAALQQLGERAAHTSLN